ncbi:uncharacterized protein LOC133903538 isoform X2 [Phragmites australis]|uniref:uncharacterized protein LOC133903538 isoform X2 n=1 Tax=Phragmites australis TaxID=29695 RepID=UPI002D79D65B|nr:uncharacterized protein LOC133903538 isoform X2 [Phragmites australis]
MAALVDLDLNCRPPSPEPAAPEEVPRAMLRQEQHFPDQMKGLHQFYGSFWKQSSDAPSNLHPTHEHKPMNLGSRGNQNPEIPSNSNKCKSLSNVAEQNLDARSSIRRKSDAYHDVIDLEKPTTSGDAVETVGCSDFGSLANQNGRSQDGSCCISPENSSLAESAHLRRGWNSSRVSPGSVGSSETPDCQSPIKPSTESRHSLIDLNIPQEESLLVFYAPSQEMYSPLFHSSLTYPGNFSKSSREVLQKECGSTIGSLKGSSIAVIEPRPAADSSRDVIDASSVQQKDLFDLNVPLESIDMPSEIISNCRDKVVNNDGSKETASSHSLSKKNSLQAETSRKYLTRNDHMLASKDDNNVLLQTSTNNGIDKVQPQESGTNYKEPLISETPVDNHVCPRLGVSHDGPSNSQVTVSMLQGEAEGDDKAAATAAETLLLFFSHKSACAADCPGSNSRTSVQDGNDEPQCSLDSFGKIVLNLEEVRDDGQSIPVLPPNNDAPSCGIKLKRGRGMRNFQREIIPGLVSLARQEICDDLDAIGYEPKKTRSRKTRRGPGASSTRSRPRKRGSAARN